MESYSSRRVAFALVLLSFFLASGPLSNRVEGAVAWWGYNWFPKGPNAFSPVPKPPAAASNVVMVAAGASHVLGLRPDGTVIGWGDQTYLQAQPPAGLTNVIQIVAGSWHSLALKNDGTVVAWGAGKTNANSFDFQMGQSQVPAGLSNVVQVAAGFIQSLALKSDGTVVAWGANEVGQSNVPRGLSNVVWITCGDSHSLAVKADGSVVSWGHYLSRVAYVPEGLSHVVAVEGGGQSLALKADGTVVAWGEANDRGQLDVPANLGGVTEIAAGGIHNLALTAEGKLIAWGAGEVLDPSNHEDYGQSIVPKALTNVSAIAAGTYQSLVVAGNAAPMIHMSPLDRTVIYGSTTWLKIQASGTRPLSYQWKFNGSVLPNATNALLELSEIDFSKDGLYSVEVSNPFGSATSHSTKVSVAPMFSSVTPNNQVSLLGWPAEFRVEVAGQGPFTYQWRFNGVNIPGATGDTLRIPRARLDRVGKYSVVVSSPLGTAESFPASLNVTKVAAWGSGIFGETNVPPGLLDVTSISAGPGFNSLALKSDGTVMAWGNNEHGESDLPANLNQVVAISAGTAHSMALKGDGTVVRWGTQDDPFAPPPPGLSNVFAIATPGAHDLALLRDGSVVGWGLNRSNQVDTPIHLGPVVAISGGYEFSIALKADGTVAHWGYLQTSGDGSPPNPEQDSPLTNVVAISGGARHYLALLADGTVATRGMGVFGPARVPPGLSNIVAVGAGGYHNLALRRDGIMLGWSPDSTNLDEVAGPGSGYGVPLYQQPLLTPKEVDCVAAISVGGFHALALIAEGPPRIESPMIDRSVNKGSTAYFRIAATGTGPLEYQWQFNGIEIEGATNSVLAVPNANAAAEGDYAVVVSNSRGSITSLPAKLSITPFQIIDSPRSKNTYRGDSVNLGVRVSGEGPFSYQWLFNGVELAAATNATLVLREAQREQSGLYSVEVKNLVGRRTTVPVEVSIGQVIEWGYTPEGFITLPGGLTNIVTIAAGEMHNLALTSEGHVISWANRPIAATLVPTNLNRVVAIDGGGAYSMALRSDGIVACWGDNSSGQTNVPKGLSNVVAIAAGSTHCLSLRANGTVVGWGAADNGQSTIPRGLSNVVAIAAGSAHSLALRADGTVRSWGGSPAPTPVGLSNVVSVAAGYQHSVALKSDGTVVAWGLGYAHQTNVPPDLRDIVQITSRGHQTYALRKDGKLFGWGDGSESLLALPAAATNISAVACGGAYVLVLVDAGPPGSRTSSQLLPGAIPSTLFGDLQGITACFVSHDGTCSFEFNTLTDRTYIIQSSTDLRFWINEEPKILGDGTHMVWKHLSRPEPASPIADPPAQFYRVILVP